MLKMKMCRLNKFVYKQRSVLFVQIILIVFVSTINGNETQRELPKNFKLGVATAAFQIEGGWNASDKSPSIWDTYCHKPNTIKDNTTADDACKSYFFYKRDIQMLKYLGVQFYRFSISWPRVLPNGFSNKISKEGSMYYSDLIDELIENNIEPIVTIYHWDLPQKLQDLGGWTNPLIADWFEDYARVLFELYGDTVKTWVTINEPKQIGLFGYGMSLCAPAINAHGIGEYLAAKHMVLAHAKAWRLYDREFRVKQNGTCGIAIATDYREGLTNSKEDIEAGLDAMDFEVGLYAHPIFSEKGGFPERVVKRVAAKSMQQGYSRSRLPEFSKEEVEFVKGTSDFYGFNHYSSKFFTRDTFKSGSFPIPSYDDDIGADSTYLNFQRGACIHCTVTPEGIRKALNWVKTNYNNPPVLILENGYGTFGGLEDEDRISYLKEYFSAVLDAVAKDECNVFGYAAWSLMDNFEWTLGLSIKFGLFEVDYNDKERKRTARRSAIWYRNLITTRILDANFTPVLEKLTF